MTERKLKIAFHWTTVALVAAVYAIALLRDGIEDPDSRLLWLDCHRLLGLAVLVLTLGRLAARARYPVPAAYETGWLLRAIAGAAHVLLYCGLIAMPLLGWAQSSARARHFRLFGVELPALVRHDGDLAVQLAVWHERLAWLILALIALHSLAALFHHFVRRDTVLVDMLRINAG
jgi:cytochrome b561